MSENEKNTIGFDNNTCFICSCIDLLSNIKEFCDLEIIDDTNKNDIYLHVKPLIKHTNKDIKLTSKDIEKHKKSILELVNKTPRLDNNKYRLGIQDDSFSLINDILKNMELNGYNIKFLLTVILTIKECTRCHNKSQYIEEFYGIDASSIIKRDPISENDKRMDEEPCSICGLITYFLCCVTKFYSKYTIIKFIVHKCKENLEKNLLYDTIGFITFSGDVNRGSGGHYVYKNIYNLGDKDLIYAALYKKEKTLYGKELVSMLECICLIDNDICKILENRKLYGHNISELEYFKELKKYLSNDVIEILENFY